MLAYPKINPNIIEIGPIKLRWYGLMYVLGFLASYLLIQRMERARKLGLHGSRLQDFMFYLAVGLVVGARLGYVLFYQFHDYAFYVEHPLEIIAIWHGGMSFHGGLLGAVLAGILFCRRAGLPMLEVADVVIITAPIGLGLGRLGNFINGELFGRPSSVPWAMLFPEGGPLPRHPSQLYEAFLEGVVLFALLWLLKNRLRWSGGMVCLFLAGYGILRFLAEFFREPDPQLGLFFGFLSMGQLLCLAMILAALCLWLLLPHNSAEKPEET
ncbi:MAG: prolipoprotein diacylglyceryl transferase [Deltaproteobacteria bacterium]|nr:prolipoprotein diacylglyceryl transferase [Deltaproteobacteria bacterium]MBW2070193.1 prolipoprotein diacylglyceryl transferase [Deltaproteobacteria bacterium]